MTNIQFTQDDVKQAFINAPAHVQQAMNSPQFCDAIRAMGCKHDLNEAQTEELIDSTGACLLGFIPRDRFAGHLAQELGVDAERGQRLASDVTGALFDSVLAGGVPPKLPTPSRNEPLYEDNRCRITYSTLEVGPTAYPMSKVGSVTQPRQLDFPIGAFLLNALFCLIGLGLLFEFSTGAVVVGLIFAAICGVNIHSMFQRPWWVTVTLAGGEELRLSRKKKDEIDGIYRGLRTAMEG